MSDRHNVSLPERNPAPQVPAESLVFSADEKAQIARYRAQYPTAEGGIMRGLWVAQEKFGFLPPEVMQLVAKELDVPYARVYGVATFYTQYYKRKMGKHVIDVCTSFSCQVCGAYDVLHLLEHRLGISVGQTTPDGQFSLQQVECLGACGSAPMLQVTNEGYVFNLTEEKIDALLDTLRAGKTWPFESVTLPQDEDEMGGNRRTDAPATVTYVTPPVAETME